MAVSQSVQIRPLESLRTADGVESIMVLCERTLQELIKAEATEAGPPRVSTRASAPSGATGTERGC